MQLKIILAGTRILVAVGALAWASAACAQTVGEATLTSKENGAKSLLGALWGSDTTENTEDREEGRLDPDRPHFPEASTAAGKGRIILESGYTFTQKDGSLISHSYPEALVRIGAFANWLEFRVGQNFINQRETEGGVTTVSSGAQDLYLGFKLALTEQRGWLPAIALIPQMTIPTGSSAVTARRVLPGLNVDFSWEIIKDFFGIEVLVANNQVKDDLGAFRHELATGLTGTFQVTKQLELFAEWDAFYPSGSLASAASRQYAVGGLVYFITRNFEVDARAGVGVNGRSNDFLAGVGFAARY
jgi:hypothetical protein